MPSDTENNHDVLEMSTTEQCRPPLPHRVTISDRQLGFATEPTSLNTSGATPFLLASLTADAELMRFLAKLGADPKIPNADNATPLIVAAGLGTRPPGEDAGTEIEVVEALRVALEFGNDIDAVDNNGESAMHGTAYKNYPAAVEFLAAHGANIDVWNRPNKHGWTPLVIAQGFRFGNFKPSPVTAGVPVPDPPKRYGHDEK
jgi:ankyrin repeat protein